MVHATVSGVVMIDGKVLLVRHTYGVAKDKLLLPGGHVKEDEMAEQAVAREILEETGVKARPLAVIGVRLKKEEWLILYRMEYISGTPVSDGYENSEVVLMRPEEAVRRDDITPLSREMCRALLTGKVIELPYDAELKFKGIKDDEYMIYGF
ncbi:MAG: NUDIX domain-containing protein [Roseburia sp.]|nr:NUDIX domain-containing protein [Roseburia sp.]